MEIQKTKHQIKLEQWRSRIIACRSSGMIVKEWCAVEGVSSQNYYRWQKQVWATETSQVHPAAMQNTATMPNALTFAEYVLPQAREKQTALVLHLSCGSLEIRNGAEQGIIENTLAALKKLC